MQRISTTGRSQYISSQFIRTRNHLICIRNEMEPRRNVRTEDTTLQTLHMATNIGLAIQHSPIVYLLLFRFVLIGADNVSLESLQKFMLRPKNKAQIH